MLDEYDATHAAVGFCGKEDWEQSDGDCCAATSGAHSVGYGNEPIFKREVGGAAATGKTITVTGGIRHQRGVNS